MAAAAISVALASTGNDGSVEKSDAASAGAGTGDGVIRTADAASDWYAGVASGNGRNRQAMPTASASDAATPSATGQRR